MEIKAMTFKELDEMPERIIHEFAIEGLIVVSDTFFSLISQPNCRYDIEFDRIDSSVKLIDWLQHLREKMWFTPDMEFTFIDAVFRKFQFPRIYC